MPQEYEPAPEVEEVARKLINTHHSHLGPARIEYVFLSEAPKVNGKIEWGRAKKISGLNAWLASESREREPEEFFVIEIVKSIWLQLNERERQALIDHELTHCEVEEDGKLSIKPHDLEEFNSIVRRYGLWRPEIEFFMEAAQSSQGNLFEAEQKRRAITLGGTA